MSAINSLERPIYIFIYFPQFPTTKDPQMKKQWRREQKKIKRGDARQFSGSVKPIP